MERISLRSDVQPTVSSPDQRQFLPRLEALRGLAALTVALVHVTLPWLTVRPRGVLDEAGMLALKAMSNGFGAVVAFFVISGFVLARSLDRDFDPRRFVRARIFRLYPRSSATGPRGCGQRGENERGRQLRRPLTRVPRQLEIRSD
jgi:peptidoglycan/LPS O-acetylase OafA/YrhL